MAPETVRYNIMVCEILRELLARSRRKNAILHDLAARAGALD